MAKDNRNLGNQNNITTSDAPTGDQSGNKAVDGGALEKLRQDESVVMTSSDRSSISEVRDAVGRRVRASYGELIQQPVPERFLRLLDELQMSEQSAKRRKK